MDTRSVIHPLSGVAPLPQFELWSVPPTQVSVVKDIEAEVRPLSALSANQPIEFIITSAPDEYVNLSETYLYIRARVRLSKEDRTEPVAADWHSVVPSQYLLHTIFSQCEVRIGDKEVSVSPPTYHYRALMDAMLGFTSKAKRSYMRAAMWTKAREDRTFAVTPVGETGTYGKWFDMMGRLHTDLVFQEKAVIGGSEIRIKLLPNDPKIYFTCSDGLKPEIEFSEVTLYVHKSKISPSLLTAHTQALASANTRYAITRTEVRCQGIPQGQLDAMLENVVRGQIPRRIFVFMVDTQTYNGSYSKDPFTFQHFNVDYLAAYIDGQIYPSRPYTPDFDSGLVIREFMSLYIALNQNRTDTYTDLDLETFKNDKAIFAFDFAPDLSNGPGSAGHVNSITSGTLRLHFRFKKQLKAAINVLIYCEFDNLIEIDMNRNAITNY